VSRASLAAGNETYCEDRRKNESQETIDVPFILRDCTPDTSMSINVKIQSDLHGDMQTSAEMTDALPKGGGNRFERNSLSGGHYELARMIRKDQHWGIERISAKRRYMLEYPSMQRYLHYVYNICV